MASVVSRTPRMKRIGRKSSKVQSHGRRRARYYLTDEAMVADDW